MVKISVIVPVYNAKDYIVRCLDSLIGQTLNDIEIIVVNDGSTDGSDKILKKYGNKIKLINQENAGVAAARNTGLEQATGEYIAYVDSDDWIRSDMFQIMYNKAKNGNFDAVMCNFTYVDDKKEWPGVRTNDKDIVTIDDKKNFMINMFPVIWNKIYKRKVIGKFRFKKGVWAEDVEYLYRILPSIRNIGIVADELYFYYQREISESRLYDKRVYNYIDNFNGIIDYYKKNKYYNKYKDELEYCYVRYIYATFVKRATYFEDKKEYDKAVNKAILNVDSKFPKYRKNKYFYNRLKGIYLLLFNRFIANLYYKVRNR